MWGDCAKEWLRMGDIGMHKVMQCRASRDYRLWLRFDDGLEGSVFLGNMLEVVAFKAWRNVDEFCRAAIDPLASTVVWNDGIRLDPDILYQDLVANKGVVPKTAASAGS
jgi:hypothetical protein